MVVDRVFALRLQRLLEHPGGALVECIQHGYCGVQLRVDGGAGADLLRRLLPAVLPADAGLYNARVSGAALRRPVAVLLLGAAHLHEHRHRHGGGALCGGAGGADDLPVDSHVAVGDGAGGAGGALHRRRGAEGRRLYGCGAGGAADPGGVAGIDHGLQRRRVVGRRDGGGAGRRPEHHPAGRRPGDAVAGAAHGRLPAGLLFLGDEPVHGTAPGSSTRPKPTPKSRRPWPKTPT